MRDPLRRSRLTELTDDDAARRVPKLVMLDPQRAATWQAMGLMDDEGLSLTAALTEVFRRDPTLREACERYQVVITETSMALARTGRVNFSKRVHGPAIEIPLEEHRPTRQQLTQQEEEMDTVNDTATNQILRLAEVEMQADKTLSRVAALSRVATREPVLYNRASRENTYDSQGFRLSHTNDASAAEDALGWKPIKFPTQPLKVTIEKIKPTSAAGPAYSAALKIIEDKAAEIMTRDGISRMAATSQAIAENPSLYAAYNEAFSRRVASYGVDTQDDGD